MDTTPESNALVSIEIQPEYFDKQMNDVDTKPTKHRKGKSIVWEYFTVENVSAGIRRACCKQCNQSFAYSMGSKVAGTSHLKRHITKGRCKVDLHNQGHLDPSTPETGPVNLMEPYPESDSAFSHAVSACLSDWNLEGKVFSLTINQSLSEIGLNSLRGLLSEKNPSILNGQLLLTNCFARSLSSIAQEALKAVQETVKKVRDTVKYVKTSESVEEKFLALKQQLQVLSAKTLLLDDQTRWNTTYEMLLAASELKEVFSCLDTLEPDYSGSPSVEEWKLVENLCTHLKLLLNTASLLTSSVVPTANMFFHEAWKLQLELTRVHELFLEYVALPVPLTPAFVEQVNGESGDQKVEDGSVALMGYG
ncbi:hypothetical protein E3N88_05931 [Mikania micrantha]|uniref:BED-type domain-containing protein n=1 Tax=Mikania micrantha TaxID=192012 RepID=A0A5N6PP66_9ASTR|nr:hypothetical protein E3N88_05931 [Mikania micrantha]